MKVYHHRAIILTRQAYALRKEEVLGTGGWIPAAEREALDWMTLIASLGWECMLRHPTELLNEPGQLKYVNWVISCTDAEDLSDDERYGLVEHLSAYPLVVIGSEKGYFFREGGKIVFQREGNPSSGGLVRFCMQFGYKEWKARKEIICNAFASSVEGEPLLWLGDAVIAVRNFSGFAKFINFSFHPGEARDTEGVFSAIIKEILISESLVPVAWYEWANTLLLRMDDPGSSQRIHDKKLAARILSGIEWRAIGQLLNERGARLSIGYVPAWVDDGDTSNSKITVKGEYVPRVPGSRHPSPYVRYERTGSAASATKVFDFVEEFRILKELIREGVVSMELHGYTHLFPDIQTWLAADDKATNSSWYREFSRKAMRYTENLPQEERPLEKGIQLYGELFSQKPSTLIFPGEEFTVEAVKAARHLGIRLIGSYYLAMPVGHQLCWNLHICSPYLDRADPSFFDHALPVVGYFHDFDVAQKGIEWFSGCLDEWIKRGASHFIDYAGLAAVLSTRLTLFESTDGYVLLRDGGGAFGLSSPVRIGMHLPASGTRWELTMQAGQGELLMPHPNVNIIQS